ncbi:uncharacterized protein LOC119357185 [Triticum dicoccoides]|uniref:uncharacterized protein LOC119357185 n=1 Tax=Triticum dicoccoides TaxID=85692 RepID=UPI00188F5437|nr:uncharacterized protein LOC119357185 [Triticum dicoccoides]
MALILSTTVQLALHLQPTAAAEVISSRGGRGQRQSAEAISRGNQQSRAGGSGISRSTWLSRRRGRSALPCLPDSSRGTRGERRPGLAAAAGVAAGGEEPASRAQAGPGTRAGLRGGGARRGGRLRGAASAGRQGSSPPCRRPTFAAAEQPQVGDGAGGRPLFLRRLPAVATTAAWSKEEEA